MISSESLSAASGPPTHCSRCSNLAPEQPETHPGADTRLRALAWVVLLLSSHLLILAMDRPFARVPAVLSALPPRLRGAQDRLRATSYGRRQFGVFFFFFLLLLLLLILLLLVLIFASGKTLVVSC